MKKIIILFAAIGLLFSSCAKEYDDSAVWQSISSLEARISAMETVMNAYKNNVTIKSVTPVANGYSILFSDGSKADIANGAKGDDGETLIDHITIGEEYITFVLTDGSSFDIPLYGSLSISFDSQDLAAMAPSTSRTVDYTVKSHSATISVEVLSSEDIKAKAVAKDNLTGSIEIRTGETIDEYSKIMVFVSDGSKVIVRTITFSQTGLKVD